MIKKVKWGIAGLMLLLGACSLPEQEITVFSLTYTFSDTDGGWTGDFADYPEGDSVSYGLIFEHGDLPDNLNPSATTKALYVSGDNGNDDLFMFVKKKIVGLRPNTTYVMLFNVKLASNAPTGSFGSEGAPGESVYLKAGASLIEPEKALQDGTYRMNIDKGDQDFEGESMINIGHIGVGSNTSQYTMITRNNNSSNSFEITTDDTGEIWLIVGTDSGYGGVTSLYYTQIDILFNRAD